MREFYTHHNLEELFQAYREVDMQCLEHSSASSLEFWYIVDAIREQLAKGIAVALGVVSPRSGDTY